MKAALGILTAVGGVSVARGPGQPADGRVCIVGAGELDIDESAGVRDRQGQDAQGRRRHLHRRFHRRGVRRRDRHEAQRGGAGAHQEEPGARESRKSIAASADHGLGREASQAGVRTNADLPDQAAAAVAFGAEGIGLCRTEHMFFDHIAEMREMIMAENDGGARDGAGQAAAVPAGRLRRACSRRWPAGR